MNFPLLPYQNSPEYFSKLNLAFLAHRLTASSDDGATPKNIT
jgi:hypothetical protein